MAIALVIIEAELDNGRTATSTHAVRRGVANTPPTDADLDALGCRGAVDQYGELAGGTPSFISSLLMFHKNILPANVYLRSIFLTDGKRNKTTTGTATANMFWSATLNESGSLPVDSDVYGYNTILQVNRIPFAYAQRVGQLELRGILKETEVKAGGPTGVTWQSNVARADVISRVENAVTTSGLDGFFQTQSSTDLGIVYSIPKYAPETVGAVQKGELIDCAAIAGLVPFSPMSRQVRKGKKRKKATT